MRKILFASGLVIALIFLFYQSTRLHTVEAKVQSSKIDIGRIEDFPAGTVKPIMGEKLIVFSDGEGLYAVSTRCTHRGCVLSFKTQDSLFVCPCHGARFDKTGAVVRGPAKTDLPWFSVEKDEEGRLFVDTSKTVACGTKFKLSTLM